MLESGKPIIVPQEATMRPKKIFDYETMQNLAFDLAKHAAAQELSKERINEFYKTQDIAKYFFEVHDSLVEELVTQNGKRDEK